MRARCQCCTRQHWREVIASYRDKMLLQLPKSGGCFTTFLLKPIHSEFQCLSGVWCYWVILLVEDFLIKGIRGIKFACPCTTERKYQHRKKILLSFGFIARTTFSTSFSDDPFQEPAVWLPVGGLPNFWHLKYLGNPWHNQAAHGFGVCVDNDAPSCEAEEVNTSAHWRFWVTRPRRHPCDPLWIYHLIHLHQHYK